MRKCFPICPRLRAPAEHVLPVLVGVACAGVGAKEGLPVLVGVARGGVEAKEGLNKRADRTSWFISSVWVAAFMCPEYSHPRCTPDAEGGTRIRVGRSWS